MKIDIDPIIEEGNKTDKICLEMRGLDAFYVIRLANGKDYTVKFESDRLAEFQPKETVSQMMAEWEENIQRRYKEALRHPVFYERIGGRRRL